MKTYINRVLQSFKNWDERKTEIAPLLKAGSADAMTVNRLQLEHFRAARHRLRKNLRPDERPFMGLINQQIINLERQLYPNLVFRLLAQIIDRLITGPIQRKQEEVRRLANIENLKEQLKEKGLGGINGKLENHLDPDVKNVVLALDSRLDQNKHLKFDLHFTKDAYGDFQLQRLDGRLLDQNIVIRAQQFEFSDWPGLKANQIWSLLEGRALKQQFTDATGHENSRWVELGSAGVQHYAPQHEFDVKKALSDYPAVTRNKDEMIKYLENGQRIATHWKQNGQFQNIYVQADPANRMLKLFDACQKPVTAEQLSQKSQKMSVTKPDHIAKTQRKGRRHGQSV